MNSEQQFPFMEKITVKGQEFVIVKHEVFHAIFNTLMESIDLKGDNVIRKTNNDYNNSLKIKRKRIRNKRLKNILNVMGRIVENML